MPAKKSSSREYRPRSILFFVAFRNACGKIDLGSALDELAARALKMPGAMCGFWGVCGSTASVGAALAIIDGTGSFSRDESYKEHMEYASSVIKRVSIIGGPRCCKRNAFLSLSSAVEFPNKRYGVPMKCSPITCQFRPTTPLASKKPALSFQRKESDKLFSISSGSFQSLRYFRNLFLEIEALLYTLPPSREAFI